MPPVAITDRIIAYYSLDDGTDAHTGGLDLTAVNGPTHPAGKIGNGAEFDVTAQSGYILANASAGAFKPGTKSLSVAFWVNVSTLPSSGNAGALVHMGATNATDSGWHVIFNNSAGNGQFIAKFSDGTTLYTASSSAIYTTGTWYHVAVTWNRKDHMRLYINGVQVVSTSISASASANVQPTQDLKIGGRHSTSVWFDGIIDEVLFWDGCMSGDVRNTHRNTTTGLSYADFAAITRPYVDQEFIHEQETNTTHAETVVSDLVEGQPIVAMLVTDGNITGASVGAWDGAWTNPIDGASPNTGTALVRTKLWWKLVTATDVSTETEVRVDWTSNEKAVLITQLWGNSAGLNVANESDTASAASSYTENGVTTDVDGCRVVVGIGIDGGTVVNSLSPGIPFNEYQVTNSAGHCGLWIGSETKATAGATGSYAFTMSASVNAVPFSFAMEPATVTVDASAADGLAFSDTASNTLVKLATALDGVTLSDAAAVTKALSTAAADGLSLSDVAVVVALYAATASDGLRWSDSATVSIVINATASDGYTFSDSAVLPTDAAYAAATVTIAAVIAASVSLQAAIRATVTIKPD